MNENDKELVEIHKDIAEKIRKMAAKVISLDGKPLPGVTTEQIKEVADVAKKFIEAQKKCTKINKDFIKEKKPVVEEVLELKARLLRDEKNFGFKFDPLVREIFNL